MKTKIFCIVIILFLTTKLFAQEQFYITKEDMPEGYEIWQTTPYLIPVADNTYQDGGIIHVWMKNNDIKSMIDFRYCFFDNGLDALKGSMYYSQKNNEIMDPLIYGGIDGHLLGDLCWYFSAKNGDRISNAIVLLRGNVFVGISSPFINDMDWLSSMCSKLIQKIESNLSLEVKLYEATLKTKQLVLNNYEKMTDNLIQSKLKDYTLHNVSDSKWIVQPDKASMGIRKEWKSTDSSVISIDLCRFDSNESAQSAAERRAECSTPQVLLQDTGYYRSPYNLDSLENMPKLIKEEIFKNDYSFVGSKGNTAVHVHFYNPKGINADTVYSVIKILAGDIINFSATSVSQEDRDADVPEVFTLDQNYPNPFNPTTLIGYQLPVAGYVTLKIYDVLGNEIAKLVDKYQQAGNYNYQLSNNNHHLSSGIYFYRLTTGSFSQTKKMLMIK